LTSFEVEPDYVDGFLEDRNLGEWLHGRTAALLGSWLMAREHALAVRCAYGVTVQTRPTPFRVVDLVVFARDAVEPIVTKPPLLCVEIAASEDRIESLRLRLLELHEMDVPDVWVIDPQPRESTSQPQKANSS
jgi:Uma2 family endonuclease